MKKRVIFIIAAIFATLFIFYNSVQPADASNQSSGVFVDAITNAIKEAGHSPRRLYITVAVRKLAHILEFALQSFLITCCFSTPFRNRIIYVLFLGLMTGCVDEYLQLFITGRSSMIQDVFVDLLGTIIGIFAFGFLLRIQKRPRKG